jgi:hypothetical protein
MAAPSAAEVRCNPKQQLKERAAWFLWVPPSFLLVRAVPLQTMISSLLPQSVLHLFIDASATN